MSKFFTVRLNTGLKIAAVALLAMHSATAAAQYRVAAFSESAGFNSLLAGDLIAAERSLTRVRPKSMAYGDINNLCVLQILTKQYDDSVASCQSALRKLKQTSMTARQRKNMAAEIYTNLAIAQHKQGDFRGAQNSLGKALSRNTSSGNAESNAIVLKINQVASN